MKLKIKKWDYMKLKHFAQQKKQVKKQPMEWEKEFQAIYLI